MGIIIRSMDMLWCQIRELFDNVSIDGVRRIVSEMISLAEWGAKDGAITPSLSNDQQNYVDISWGQGTHHIVYDISMTRMTRNVVSCPCWTLSFSWFSLMLGVHCKKGKIILSMVVITSYQSRVESLGPRWEDVWSVVTITTAITSWHHI